MHIHFAEVKKVGLKWKVKKITAKNGDIIVWKLNKRFQLWFPAGNNPFNSYEIVSGKTDLYVDIVKGLKRKYTYSLYIVDEPDPEQRWAEGNTPPTIIIK
jgi:hypothetical protein